MPLLVWILTSLRFLFLGTSGTLSTSKIQTSTTGVPPNSRVGFSTTPTSWIQEVHHSSFRTLTSLLVCHQVAASKVEDVTFNLTLVSSMVQIHWMSQLARTSLISVGYLYLVWTVLALIIKTRISMVLKTTSSLVTANKLVKLKLQFIQLGLASTQY